MSTQTARQDAPSTKKGRATRDRIIAAAADLMYQHGAAGTSTPALRDAAGVSSSQIYHYFADKDPLLARLDSLDALNAWRDVVVDAARQYGGTGGCPLGSLSSELSDHNPQAREALAASFTAWAAAIREGLLGMLTNGTLRPQTDADKLALALLTAVQGGLLLAQAQHTTDALEAAIDTVIAHIHDQAPARQPAPAAAPPPVTDSPPA
jgi:TetR/AcrR family transcriptional repressor of nem operon